jgi:hypothetical protein
MSAISPSARTRIAMSMAAGGTRVLAWRVMNVVHAPTIVMRHRLPERIGYQPAVLHAQG